MPIYLESLHASNTLIGIVTGGLAGLVNVLFLPNISQWSDRFRSKLGRRIPFLLVVTPLTTLSLMAVGFSPEIAAWCHRYVTAEIAPWLTQSTLLLSLICVFAVSFHFFNMVLVGAYNWLLRDVVPQVFMARFLSWFRVVGTVASVIFLFYVFPVIMSYRRTTFLLMGGFYMVVFMTMCWKVREGQYPDPETGNARDNFLSRFGTYFRDCLSVPLYRNYFIVYLLVLMAGMSATSFSTLYASKTLGLSMADMGHLWAYAQIASAFLFAPVGWLCERFTPMRVVFCSIGLLLFGALCAYFLVHDKLTWMIYSLLISIPFVGWGLGSMTVTMQLFPQKYFGQFSAGVNVFGCGGLFVGNYLIGVFMDLNHSNYRMVFLWSAFFYMLATIPMLALYRAWKNHGGPDHYEAPLPRHLSP